MQKKNYKTFLKKDYGLMLESFKRCNIMLKCEDFSVKKIQLMNVKIHYMYDTYDMKYSCVCIPNYTHNDYSLLANLWYI